MTSYLVLVVLILIANIDNLFIFDKFLAIVR